MTASQDLKDVMSDLDKSSKKAFKMTVEGFLGNHRRNDYVLNYTIPIGIGSLFHYEMYAKLI